MDPKELLDAVSIGAFVIDREFRVLHWNRTVETWTGIQAASLLGRMLDEKLPHLGQPGYRSRLAGIFEGGPPVVFSAQFHGDILHAHLPGGSPRVHHTVVSAVRDESGGGYHAFFSVQDVSEITKHARNYSVARNEALREIKRREAVERELVDKSARLEDSNREMARLNSELGELYGIIEEEVKLAADFQSAMLPNIGDRDFLRIACRYFPSRVVSGDVYEVTATRERAVRLFLGDATGHGITAAFLTMMLHMGFRSLNGQISTDSAMNTLNDMFISVDTAGKFVTGICAKITALGLLSITHAGHSSAIVFPAGRGDPVRFATGGMPLGLFSSEMSPYQEELYQLAPGDRCFLFTDGITERENSAAEQFGEDRLADSLLKTRNESLEKALDAVLEAADRFAEGIPANDDVTFVGVEFTG